MSEEESVGDVENDLEIILDGDQQEYQAEVIDGENNEDNREDAEGDTKKVKPKRVVKNPQPKLNDQTLKGPRGLVAIESYFDRVKFKGRGHEEEDLNTLLKTYEYWCHRLFPKYPFDSCLARLEKLGTKRGTQVQVKKIRMGLVFEEPEKLMSEEEEVNDAGGLVDADNDQFDQLVSNVDESESVISEEQLERMRQNMEKAKRLREEKLKQIQEKSQNILNTRMDICGSDTFQNLSNENVNTNENNSEDATQEHLDEMQTEAILVSECRAEDNEEHIENILNDINADNSEYNEEILNNQTEIDDNSTTLEIKSTADMEVCSSM